MTLSILTNSASLNAQRTMGQNSNKLQTNFERLSSGLRINSAKDDAAGLAITDRFTSQIRGLNQAVRNANDGISMSQTAESGLEEIGNILQRLRELSVQSSNDSNTATDRQAIQTEADALTSEIDRISGTTNFNGRQLLDGSFSGAKIQVGSNSGQSIEVSIDSAQTANLGAVASKTTATVTGTAMSAGDVVLNGVSVRASSATDDTKSSTGQDASAISKAAAINASSAQHGVTATVNANEHTGAAEIADAGGTLDGTNYIEINGVRIQGDVINDDADGALRAAINAVSGQTGVVASLDGGTATDQKLVLTAADGRNINVAAGGTGATITGVSAGTTYGTMTLESDSDINITSTGTIGNAGLTTGITSVNTATNIGSMDLSTQAGADASIGTIDKALRQVSKQRASLGATLNRLESTVSNLSASSENLSAARSRIMDADFASETADFSKSQILQQASTSILAQANVSNQAALSLLG